MLQIKNILSIVICVCFLSACFTNKAYDFSGTYIMRIGDECSTDPSNKRNKPMIEIIKINESNSYKARIMISSLFSPDFYSEISTPVDDSLSFNFYQEGVSARYVNKPSISIELHVEKNKYFANHIILNKFNVEIIDKKQEKSLDLIAQMLIEKPNMAFKRGQVDGICLKNLVSREGGN